VSAVEGEKAQSTLVVCRKPRGGGRGGKTCLIGWPEGKTGLYGGRNAHEAVDREKQVAEMKRGLTPKQGGKPELTLLWVRLKPAKKGVVGGKAKDRLSL